jgi:predicted O-linked N-acetylglucosamine transferase (SPINDLY family)
VASRVDTTFQRAVSSLQAGRADEAERLFTALLGKAPRHVGGLNLFGVLLTRLGRYQEAEQYIRRALRENAKSDVTFYNLGIVLKALKRPAEAYEQFGRALAINGAVAETWNNRGTVLNELKRYSEAIADFDRAISLKSDYAEAHYHKGASLSELKRHDQALLSYEQALALKPDLAEAWSGRGNAQAALGNLDAAAAAYERALQVRANFPEAWAGLGNVHAERQQHDSASQAYDRALKLRPDLAEAWLGHGNTFVKRKRYGDALAAYDRALALAPELAEAWLGRGNALAELGKPGEAGTAYDRALALDADLAQAWLGRGTAAAQLGRHDEAFAAYDRALACKPDLADAWVGRGNVLVKLKRYDEAFAAYDRALAIAPELAEAWVGRGNALAGLKRLDDAAAAYDRALAAKPDLAEAWLGRGNVLVDLKRHDEAPAAFARALTLKPDLAEAWHGRGNVFVKLGRAVDALAAYDRALALKPTLAEAWFSRGDALGELKRYDDASASYEKALAIKPDLAEAWVGLANIHGQLGRDQQAIEAFDKALTIQPDFKFAAGTRHFTKLKMCDWTGLEANASDLLAKIRDGFAASLPFCTLCLPSSPADQLQCAKSFVAEQFSFPNVWRGDVYRDRIRVAYVSADLRDHAVAHLIAGLFDRHDKSRFEMTAISFGPDQDSDLRRRIKNSFEHFIDAGLQSDQDIAELIRRREIDIAVDLNGFTEGFRLNVFARRPAPIQVNYLGYAGTIGADYFDYILADSTVIPQGDFEFYSEKAVWLPGSYLPYDATVRISEPTPTRRDCGLPEAALVFCCFNNAYKFAPEMFRIWMNLLKATHNSVLWLTEGSAAVSANLRREAERAGVAPERLIFAPKVPAMADHLARYRQADLFLDTLPYNAHTTAADALWAGLPVVTCLGSAFAGRVAASLLRAAGLPELVTQSLDDYQALALKLAREPALLASFKDRLARNRLTHLPFDTPRFARQVEAAYTKMWQRHQAGERPESFAVDPIA